MDCLFLLSTNDMMGTRFLEFHVRSGGGSLLTKIWKLTLTSKLAQDGINIGEDAQRIFSERFIKL